MLIKALLLHCLLQIFGLMIILFHKRFKTAPNMLLNYILLTLIVHLGYDYLETSGFNVSGFSALVLCFEFTAPIAVYFYAFTVIKGKMPTLKQIIPHLILPCTLFGLLTASDIFQYEQAFVILKYTAHIALMTFAIIYPLFVIYRLSTVYHLKSFGRVNIFKYNKDKTVMLRLVVTMMLLNGILMIPEGIMHTYFQEYIRIIEVADILFFIVLSYLFGYHIITNPQSIHHDKRRFALHNYDKYLRSGLQEGDAKAIADRLNEYFQSEKPYLNPDLNLNVISEQLQIPSHHITETLNGLIGQNFNEYVNNYRIEEFKSLLEDKKYEHFSILALAFEVGFKSKGTFNAAFKKFTNQTPSEYRKELINNDK